MTFKTFLKLIEIQTKVASVFPFLIGSLFVYFHYDSFKPINTLIFFSAMLLFDCTTTAINHYMDYKKATTDTYRNEKNIIGMEQIPKWQVMTVIFGLLLTAACLGIWLVFRTDLIVLLIGILCFCIGIFYTFGPLPLSRLPVGEFFSGVTMGFGIMFLTVYVNAFDKGIAHLAWANGFHLQADARLIFEIVLISLPCVFTIANIMLANNICDLEEDIANKRFTLPYYIGKKHAVRLFDALYVATFAAIIMAVALKLLPMLMLLTLLVAVPVYKHVRRFNRKQVKSETFVVSVKNHVIVNSTLVIMFLCAQLI